MSRSYLYPVALFALVAPYAEAAETGSLRGTVNDDAGTEIPGATITLSGPNIAGELSTSTDANGNFRFVQVPPGTHSLTVVKPGLGQVTMRVTIHLDETAFAPVILKVGSGAEVLIEETLPVIDTTRSAVSTSLTYEGLANLPTSRSYTDVVNMLAGVSGRVDTQNGGDGNGNPSVRGEGQYGNNFLMDGISTRDPATKTFGTDINFDVIQEMQVYTDGAPAEYGEVTGMLVNVITKDGGDEHHGSAAYYLGHSASWGTYKIADLATNVEVDTTKRQFFDNEVALVAGGPIVKEKLWYMASVNLNSNSSLPEGSAEGADPRVSKGLGGFAKLTWFPSPALTLHGQFSGQNSGIDNYETSAQVLPEAQDRYESRDLAGTLSAEVKPGDSTVIEAQAIYWQGQISVVPMSGDWSTPSITNIDTGEITNNWTDFDYDTRTRWGGNVKLTQLVHNVLGEHRFKVGGEYYTTGQARNLQYTGAVSDPTSYDPDAPTVLSYSYKSSADYPCTAEADYQDCYAYTESENVGPLPHTGRVFSTFIQDDWQPVNNVTGNLGVRLDHEQLLQNADIAIVDQWMVSPRLGAAWDVRGDSKTAVTVNAGRYYDVSGDSFAQWGDTRSANVYREYTYNPDTGVYDLTWDQDPTSNPSVYCNQQSLDQVKGSDRALYDTIVEKADDGTSMCDTDGDGSWDLKPYHLDKMVLGVKHEILPLFAIGIRGMLSQTVDLPEDVDIDANTFLITSPESKRRDYRALELTAERKFDKHWQLIASYTLSESKGTNPGQFETASGGATGSNGNEVGVYLDDVNLNAEGRAGYTDAGLGWLINGLYGLGTNADDAGYYGYLPYHSFHSVKINGSYTFNQGSTIGVIYEFDSGHAYQKRGYVDLYGDYFAFPEGRGSRFMPAVNYVDMHFGQKFFPQKPQSVELSVDVFNIFDFHAPTTYYENDDANFGLTLYRQAPRSVLAGLKFTY